MSDDRLIDLETRLAFHEDALAKLDEVVIRQQRQLDEIANKIVLLTERLAGMDSADGGVPEQGERPPHY